jgi:hypothetical protein
MGLAFINMLVFQLVTSKSVTKWDRTMPTVAAKIAGALSLRFWIGVVYFARMTGFTMVQGGAWRLWCRAGPLAKLGGGPSPRAVRGSPIRVVKPSDDRL